MKVRAILQGFYKGRHIDPGTIFEIDSKDYAGCDDADQYRAKCGWMEMVDDGAPLSTEASLSERPKKKSIVDRIMGK